MFSKKSDLSFFQSEPRVADTSPTPVSSVIGAEVTIRGDLETEAELLVDGIIEGNLSCRSVVQGETSRVEGTVKALEDAQVAGRIQGSVTARNLVVQHSARIDGEVHYETLIVERGALIEGRMIRIEPTPQAAKAAPLRAVKDADSEASFVAESRISAPR